MKARLLICVSLTQKNRHQIPMFRQLLNSLFLYSNPNRFRLLLLLDQDTVTPVMRIHEIDSFAYTVALTGIEDQLEFLMSHDRVLTLTPNVLLQDNVVLLMDLLIKAKTVYTDESGAVSLCEPFKGMFAVRRRDTILLQGMVSQVRTLKDCFVDHMFLLFHGASEHKKFVQKYFGRLMMNKCAER